MCGPVRRSAVLLVAGGALAVMALIVGVVLLGSSDPSDEATGPATTADPTSSAPSLADECASAHAGHNLMMWNPVMADEMLDAGCPWPYPPFDVAGGGDDVGGSDAASPPFEARRYDELWTMLGDAGLGVCEVRSLPDPPAEGFAFGFVYAVAEPGCPDRDDAVEMQVREYVGVTARDRAATQTEAPLVLGRWVVSFDGGDEGRRTELRASVIELGAVEP